MWRTAAAFGPFLALAWVGLAFGQAPVPAPSATPPAPPGSASAAPVGSGPAGSAGPPPAASASAAPAPDPAAPDPAASAPAGASPPELAEPPPPPAPPPPVLKTEYEAVEPAPVSASPSASVEPPPAAEEDAPAPSHRPDAWRDGHGLGLEGTLGVAARIGALNEGFADEEHFDTAFTLGAWFGLSSAWAVGLEFEHAGLGRAATTLGLNSVSVEYDVNYLWLGARVFPYRSDEIDLFLHLRGGLGWQSLDATGTRDQLPTTAAPRVFACSASDGPGLGLGAGVGIAYRVSPSVLVLGRVDGAGRRQSAEILNGCSAGAGDITSVNAGAGLMYVFDLGSGASLSARGGPAGALSY